jgi:hypothetical protein
VPVQAVSVTDNLKKVNKVQLKGNYVADFEGLTEKTSDFKELVLITYLGLEKFLIGSTIDELP